MALDRAANPSWRTPVGRSPLRLEITLSAPLEEQETWFLVCVFEHAGRVLFEKGKYASEFAQFPWQR